MEMIVFIGLQGAGKSTYYLKHFSGTHVHVSKDLMKSARSRDVRQQQMLEEALGSGQSVVIDNTNPTPAVRAPLIELGRRFGARLVACYFSIPVKVAVARNRQREGKARVPDVAIFVTAKKLVPPTVEEGFDEIRIINAEAEANAEVHA